MELSNQEKRLVEYLKSFSTINPLQAWSELGIYRLSAVVNRLRNKGYDINTSRKSVLNKYQEPCSFAVYELERAS